MSGSTQAAGSNYLALSISPAPSTSLAIGGWVKVNGWDKNAAGYDTYFSLVAPVSGMYLQQDQTGTGTADKAAVAYYDEGTIGQADDDILPLNTWTFVFVVCTGAPLTINVYWGPEEGPLNHEVINGNGLSVTGLTTAFIRIPNGTNPHIATNGANWTLTGTFANDTSDPDVTVEGGTYKRTHHLFLD